MSTPSVVLTIIVPLIGVVVYLLPAPFEPVGFELQSPPYLGDALPVNDHLQRAEKILENQVLGPESLVFKDGDIYSGTADGKIIKINSNLELTNVLSLGSVYCGERTRLVSGGTIVDGKPIVFFNDLAVRSDGMVYFTHSSTKWHRFQHVSLAMEGNNDSRLLQFDPTSGEVSVLMDGLTLGNGVQLSQDESFLLVAEGGRMRIHQYFLTSSREGEREIFADNLPGFVDNIRPSSSGGFWVALPTIRRHCLYDVFAPRPWLRKFLIKFFSPEFIVKSTTKPYGLVMEFAEDGHIVRRLDDPTGAVVSYISEVLDTGSSLYLGSYTSPFLAKLSLE
ncbi:adipocyte plasma membrane-associated protein isoform X2 [Strongylocentrotus purpuratus]|uniref:Strictosidine synthase conserved region domain-containing protein n=1 Tax=Strongylocentrotus purpuratus TaxID=7668 RepID=A0A7M7T570_STRPU|nr:adipocyte plasma membrane-associated protein isoform X2 [Strongylocentrotus purpuratus]